MTVKLTADTTVCAASIRHMAFIASHTNARSASRQALIAVAIQALAVKQLRLSLRTVSRISHVVITILMRRAKRIICKLIDNHHLCLYNTRLYGVVPKGLFTILGSVYKEVAKTTSGTFERQTARNFFPLSKNTVSST